MEQGRAHGSNNVKNGPDYVLTSPDGTITQFKCKYYRTASETISACFEDGVFRYYSDTNVPMTIEVPADQYDKAVLLMKTESQMVRYLVLLIPKRQARLFAKAL